MVRRDPQTGQFQAGDDYDDVEVVTFTADAGIMASEATGATGFGGQEMLFEGVPLIDYDDVVDRNESLQLLRAEHRMVVFMNSTQTADGTLVAAAEVSSSPSRSSQAAVNNSQNDLDESSGLNGVGTQFVTDSIDLLGRPLEAVATAPFSDGPTGVGGGGAGGDDTVEVVNPPGVVGQFHPRDELFLNGSLNLWNVDDAGGHIEVKGQHVYGVVSD